MTDTATLVELLGLVLSTAFLADLGDNDNRPSRSSPAQPAEAWAVAGSPPLVARPPVGTVEVAARFARSLPTG
jgi:hypothetical protein